MTIANIRQKDKDDYGPHMTHAKLSTSSSKLQENKCIWSGRVDCKNQNSKEYSYLRRKEGRKIEIFKFRLPTSCTTFANFYLQGVAKHQDFKLVDDEPPNDTDVEATLQKVKDNDSETKEVILNNIKASNVVMWMMFKINVGNLSKSASKGF